MHYACHVAHEAGVTPALPKGHQACHIAGDSYYIIPASVANGIPNMAAGTQSVHEDRHTSAEWDGKVKSQLNHIAVSVGSVCVVFSPMSLPRCRIIVSVVRGTPVCGRRGGWGGGQGGAGCSICSGP